MNSSDEMRVSSQNATVDSSDEDIGASKWCSQSSMGPWLWIQQQFSQGRDPREILSDMLPNTVIPPEVDDLRLWKIIFDILNEPPSRPKLALVNTLEDVVHLVRRCSRIIVLTGAGISVSCGIPDFRSRDGIYARLRCDFPDLPDPQAMFDIHYFRRDQRPFFKFAREIYPGLFEPSISHKFIKSIAQHGKLLRNYTQNIDTLEKAAGIERVVTCHGSFATATCTRCKYQVDSSSIKADIFAQKIPLCPKCPPDCEDLRVMKPDIVFFGESLPDEFHDSMAMDKDNCDLLIVMGSSLKVRPVSLIPMSIPPEVPQILINREPLDNMTFDVELLGDCDVIVQEICNRLGGDWTNICVNKTLLREVKQSAAGSSASPLLLQPKPLSQLPNHIAQPSSSSASASPASTAKDITDCEINNNSDLDSTGSAECSNSAEDVQYRFNEKLDDLTIESSNDSGNVRSMDANAEPTGNHNTVPEGCFIRISTSRYVFSGAERYSEDQMSSDGDDEVEEDDEDEDDEEDENDDNNEYEWVDAEFTAAADTEDLNSLEPPTTQSSEQSDSNKSNSTTAAVTEAASQAVDADCKHPLSKNEIH